MSREATYPQGVVRAIGVREFGAPDAIKILHMPEQHAGPGEVRVRVRAAGVNPTDTFRRSGHWARFFGLSEPQPTVPGMDIAGEIDEVGADVHTGVQIGEAVMGIVVPAGPFGGYCESVVLPAESVVRVPAGASFARPPRCR